MKGRRIKRLDSQGLEAILNESSFTHSLSAAHVLFILSLSSSLSEIKMSF